jgi:hypothetical protein
MFNNLAAVRRIYAHKYEDFVLVEVSISNSIAHYEIPTKEFVGAVTDTYLASYQPTHPWELDMPDYELTHDYTQLESEKVPSEPTCKSCGTVIHDMYCGACDSLALGY